MIVNVPGPAALAAEMTMIGVLFDVMTDETIGETTVTVVDTMTDEMTETATALHLGETTGETGSESEIPEMHAGAPGPLKEGSEVSLPSDEGNPTPCQQWDQPHPLRTI